MSSMSELPFALPYPARMKILDQVPGDHEVVRLLHWVNRAVRFELDLCRTD